MYCAFGLSSHVDLAAPSRIKYLVEIVGTFILVYAVCTAGTVYSGPNKGIIASGLYMILHKDLDKPSPPT